MLSEEQAKQIKTQLLQQVEQLPKEQKGIIKQQIQQMNAQQLEAFLQQNNISVQQETKNQPQTPQCVFCAIIEGQIPSYKIDENKASIAVLEINPISKAHSIIIPKKHVSSIDKLPATAFSLAKKISKKIKTKFKAQEVNISSSLMFGHAVINIIPVYKDQEPNQERKKADEKELLEIQNKLEKKSKPKTIKTPKKQIEEKIRLPKRIP